jgi:hypothetical protein
MATVAASLRKTDPFLRVARKTSFRFNQRLVFDLFVFDGGLVTFATGDFHAVARLFVGRMPEENPFHFAPFCSIFRRSRGIRSVTPATRIQVRPVRIRLFI